MPWFKLKGKPAVPGRSPVKPVTSHGYTFEPGVPLEVTDGDLIGRLCGTRTRPHDPLPHPSFEEVAVPDEAA